ncbi:hypothetical protein [Arthrobacter sp. CAN_A1]|uniref:hypothetical protein n=1 Tax=Arthrobacter sp. CAN_A1 TaxID=2787717 RepID=UPI0018C9C855
MSEFVPETTACLDFQRPRDWLPSQVEGVDLVVLAPAHWGLFRPSLVVTSQAYDGSIAKLSTFAMAAAMGELKHTHLIACDIWQHPSGPGRKIDYTHQLNEQVLHVQRWTFAHRGYAVDLTATCATTQLTSVDSLFDHVARTLHLRGES